MSRINIQNALTRFRLPIALLGILALVLVGVFLSNLAWLTVVTSVFMFLPVAQAWNILGGYGGYLNLGVAAFWGLGAYTTAVLNSNLGLSPFLTAPLGGLVAVIYGVLVGVPSLRIRGHYFAILTLVTTFVVKFIIVNVKMTRGAEGILLKGLPYDTRTNLQIFYFVFLGFAVLATLVVYIIENSKFGHALVAIREDEDAAEILGVRTFLVKVAGLLIGAVLVGTVGGLYSLRIVYIEPDGLFNIGFSIDVILMTLIGGAGTWQGPIIGVPAVMMIAEVLRVGVTRIELFGTGVPTAFNRVGFGALLILVTMFAKKGIMGFIKRTRGRRFSV